MEESKLYTARVQVVEAMERGIPWHEAAKLAPGFRSANPPPIGFVSACAKQERWHCVRADMDILSNCEAKCGSFWNGPVGWLLLPRATRFKGCWPTTFPFRSASVKSTACAPR